MFKILNSRKTLGPGVSTLFLSIRAYRGEKKMEEHIHSYIYKADPVGNWCPIPLGMPMRSGRLNILSENIRKLQLSTYQYS